MGPKFTDDELEGLTEDERLGLLEEDEDDADAGEGDGEGNEGGDGAQPEDKPAAAASDDDADGEGDDEGEGEGTADDAKPDPAAAADAAAAEPAPEEEGEGQQEEPEERAPKWVLPPDIDDKIKAIDEQMDDLAAKFDEGELTGKEFREQTRTLGDQRDELKQVKIKAEIQKETAIETWYDEVGAFLGKPENAAFKSPILQGMLDTEVKRLQSEATNPLNPAILAKAKANIAGEIKAAFGIDVDPGKPGKKDAAPDGKGKADPKTPPKKRPEMPPNLGNVPSADITESDDGGEFAYLERLMNTDSLEYEKALAKLSPEQQDRWLAST
ncbi:hypothetical protein [Ciceribacter sp. L1K22]|uniref:hypothetical protein n=1 Tax=Ciceribacter sp. L1K22 TaxID=2820275 RepID=UPI001ABE7194|nr:hypothetical protein [Ciceribacter sp. L1K22]MBO3760365.1 hypothetical protein [Ciceribacter sp. L1K22]